MSITMHTGRPGTGKTYSAVRDILKLLNEGEIVYSNIKIDWEGGYRKKWNWRKLRYEKIAIRKSNLRFWKRLSDLYPIQNGTIFMDEAHIYMRSRGWDKLPEEMERKLAQHRKDGLHIIGTVQNINRIDKIFRELVDFWYVYERTLFGFVRWEFNIDDDKLKRFPLTKKRIFLRKKIYQKYDTFETVKILE